jgi:hypothetical protein
MRFGTMDDRFVSRLATSGSLNQTRLYVALLCAGEQNSNVVSGVF